MPDRPPLPPPLPATLGDALQARDAARRTLDAAERAVTLAALRATQGNRTHAASLLGIPLRTMFRRVAALGDDAPPPPEQHTAGGA